MPPVRRPYDSLEAIHSVDDLVSTSSLTTDPSLELESLDETLQRPNVIMPAPPSEHGLASQQAPSSQPAPSGRPQPPSVGRPQEPSGTRELREIQSPPLARAAAPSIPPSGADDSSLLDLSPQPLPRLLKLRAVLGSGSAPLWVIGLGAMVIVGALTMMLSSVVTALLTRSPATGATASASATTVLPPEEPPPPPIPSQPPGPKTADPSHVASLAKKAVSDRSAAETLTLAEATREERRQALGKMQERLLGKEPSGEETKELRDAVADGEVGFAALRVMAVLSGPVGPDLIYESWTKPRDRTPTTELAEALVYSKDIRAKASPALNVALELRAAEECEAVQALVKRATEEGDRRSLAPLSRLTRKSGCGQNKRQDCFPCLGQRKEVVEALRAVGKRQPPRY